MNKYVAPQADAALVFAMAGQAAEDRALIDGAGLSEGEFNAFMQIGAEKRAERAREDQDEMETGEMRCPPRE